MKTHLLEIDSAEALSAVQDEARRGGPRRFTGFTVSAPGASDAVNDAWRQRIERDYFACGCAHGTVASLASVLICLGWFISRSDGWRALTWTDGLVLAAVFVAATGFGKLIGIRIARGRLRATLDELAAVFPRRPAPEPGRPAAHCAVHS